MKHISLAILSVMFGAMAACQHRNIPAQSNVKKASEMNGKKRFDADTWEVRCESSETKKIYLDYVTQKMLDDGHVCLRGTNPVDGSKFLSAKPFNAFAQWNSGAVEAITDYPSNWAKEDPSLTKDKDDGIFYSKDCFTSSTKNAFYDRYGEELIYPMKDKRRLIVSFDDTPGPLQTNHKAAAAYCRSAGKRLPTLQEAYDACQAKNNLYPAFYCEDIGITWTATVDPSNPSSACVIAGSRAGFEVTTKDRRFGEMVGQLAITVCVSDTWNTAKPK